MNTVGILAEIQNLRLMGWSPRSNSKNFEESRLHDTVLIGMEKDIKVEVRCVVMVEARMPKRPWVLTFPIVFFDIVDLIRND